jgi:hypothetical protein
MVDRSWTVDGKITSLLELGYNRIGLDDAWQVPSTVHALYRGLTYILYLVQNEMITIHSAISRAVLTLRVRSRPAARA